MPPFSFKAGKLEIPLVSTDKGKKKALIGRKS